MNLGLTFGSSQRKVVSPDLDGSAIVGGDYNYCVLILAGLLQAGHHLIWQTRENILLSYFHQHHTTTSRSATVRKQLSFSSLTWSFPNMSYSQTNLFHRMVKSANHGGIEVAELILVVADILLVAVWHLQRDSEVSFSKGKARSKTSFACQPLK